MTDIGFPVVIKNNGHGWKISNVDLFLPPIYGDRCLDIEKQKSKENITDLIIHIT